MINRIRAARSGDDGFTLIEMLIVIVVLGILAGITVFGIAHFREDASAATCKTDASTVQAASDAYKAQTGGYAATVAALKAADYIKADPGDVNYDATTGKVTQKTGTSPC